MTQVLDLAGIGIGPFNLSVAALLHGTGLRARFFDSKAQFSWHRGMLLPHAELQTSYLKDLVTPADPRNPYSFLAYLVAKRRFYEFVNAEQSAVTRREFGDYLGWAASRIDGLHFGAPVISVEFDRDHFVLTLPDETVRARNLCVGVGKPPHVPECVRQPMNEQLFHVADIAERRLDLRGKRVAVIGGGQSGAEVVLSAIENHWGVPQSLSWISRRPNFLPLDETPFTNEWFTPSYVDAFHALPASRRADIVASQKLASDGISPRTLKALYQCFYRLRHLEGRPQPLRLLPGRNLTGLQPGSACRLELRNDLDGAIEYDYADIVILCTGFAERFPECLSPLRERIRLDEAGRLPVKRHFAVQWNGPAGNRIYALNAGRHSHGIAEPQLSLMAWRSAQIVNDLSGRHCYDMVGDPGMIEWRSEQAHSAVA